MKYDLMRLFNANKKKYTKDQIELIEAIENARLEIDVYRSMFDEVTDPSLIEFAIYNEEATMKKYIYLLLQARKKGINLKFSDKHLEDEQLKKVSKKKSS
ncbi:MAG: DUF2508 family protein [Clostridiaceae bacterium]